jgi:hypothetical protein
MDLSNNVLCRESVWVSGYIDSCFSWPLHCLRWVVSFTPLPLYSRGKSPRCSLEWRLRVKVNKKEPVSVFKFCSQSPAIPQDVTQVAGCQPVSGPLCFNFQFWLPAPGAACLPNGLLCRPLQSSLRAYDKRNRFWSGVCVASPFPRSCQPQKIPLSIRLVQKHSKSAFILVIPSVTTSALSTGHISTKFGIAVAKYCREILIFVFSQNQFTWSQNYFT